MVREQSTSFDAILIMLIHFRCVRHFVRISVVYLILFNAIARCDWDASEISAYMIDIYLKIICLIIKNKLKKCSWKLWTQTQGIEHFPPSTLQASHCGKSVCRLYVAILAAHLHSVRFDWTILSGSSKYSDIDGSRNASSKLHCMLMGFRDKTHIFHLNKYV